MVCAGLEHYTPGYAIRRETFPFYSIEYAARGRGKVKLKGRACSLQPGRLFSYGPGVPQHIIGDAADPLVKVLRGFFRNARGRAIAFLRAFAGAGFGGVSGKRTGTAL